MSTKCQVTKHSHPSLCYKKLFLELFTKHNNQQAWKKVGQFDEYKNKFQPKIKKRK
jgi:hypothetical protein